MFRVNVQCPPAAAIAPFTDCVANHFLVQTVPFLLDTLAQLFHIRDLVGSPTPRSRRGSDPDCVAATERAE